MSDRIHTDSSSNAPELVSSTVQQFCAQHNIVHTTIIPDHQFQNGKAETCIGDIKGKEKTLMMVS
jgi:transposase InsO family protein